MTIDRTCCMEQASSRQVRRDEPRTSIVSDRVCYDEFGGKMSADDAESVETGYPIEVPVFRKDVCAGFHHKIVAKALVKRGVLMPRSDGYPYLHVSERHCRYLPIPTKIPTLSSALTEQPWSATRPRRLPDAPEWAISANLGDGWEHDWSPRQESNLYLALRRRLFYPLNYGESHVRQTSRERASRTAVWTARRV